MPDFRDASTTSGSSTRTMVGDSAIAASIEKTVAYFSLFQYPLTSTEIWQLLWSVDGESQSLPAVTFELDENKTLLTRLKKQDAFFQLIDSPLLGAVRQHRYRIATVKMRRAKRAVRLMSYLPWVEGIAVCNSLGYQNTREESDIDFFIITQPSTLWLTRFIVTGVMKLFRLRPQGEHTPDALCLSFFVTSNALNLAPLALPGGDPYLTYWVAQLTPLFGRGLVWERFWSANQWVRVHLPNAPGYASHPHSFYRESKVSKTAGRAVRWLDRALEGLQRQRFPLAIREGLRREDTCVVASRDVLKFHVDDRRRYYRDAWQKRLRGIII